VTLVVARRKAEALISKLGVVSPPVNVAVVAKSLGIKVVETSLGDDVSGMLITKGGTITICVEESHPEVRRRFSIAHEIGHHALGHQFEPGEHVHVDRGALVSMRNRLSAEGTDHREIEANQFAACLLMPRAMVEAELLECGSVISEEVISGLAKSFKVSEQAMTIRLGTLGFQ
jgi:Zn-dependent peptidase ImmA (M78 family)